MIERLFWLLWGPTVPMWVYQTFHAISRVAETWVAMESDHVASAQCWTVRENSSSSVLMLLSRPTST